MLGVCSWSLQVASIAELAEILGRLGLNHVQLACGDPNHASWIEGGHLPAIAKAATFVMTGAMLGFAGEDYTTPQTIRATGGFGPINLRGERMERLAWGIQRTLDLGLSDLSLHAGFIPAAGATERRSFLDALATAGRMAGDAGVALAFETGQETAELLRATLDELACPALGVNFDPANMLLYDMGDPLRAVETLAPNIRSVHLKDAVRPTFPGEWGRETPLGQGQVNLPAFLATLDAVGFAGPMCVERESGTKAERFTDIAAAAKLVNECRAAK